MFSKFRTSLFIIFVYISVFASSMSLLAQEVKAPQDYSKQIEAIRTAKDLTELQTLWKALDSEGQTACLAVKDSRKLELTK